MLLRPLLCLAVLLLASLGSSAQAAKPPRWLPESTRLVVVSLARFAGEADGQTSFSLADRLDDPLVELFIARGVPEAQILYLKDAEATKAAITKKLPAFLGQSHQDETLIFYFSSHGGYDPKSGAHTFYAFDGPMPIGWFVGNIEARFKGQQAMLFSDCCYSGGLVQLAEGRTETPISYAALSTTGSCNLAYSGWRFTDLLLRAWSGDVAMDVDASGSVSFAELCVFAERYMAFVAEGKPLYASTGSFDVEVTLAKADRPAKPGLGAFVEAKDGKQWFKAEVINRRASKEDSARSEFLVHFTDKSRYTKRAWLPLSDIREYKYATYPVGAKVEIRSAAGEWLPGQVIAAFDHMHECSYDGKSALYNEWMSPSRIRSRK